jgi:hypothetical protein
MSEEMAIFVRQILYEMEVTRHAVEKIVEILQAPPPVQEVRVQKTKSQEMSDGAMGW